MNDLNRFKIIFILLFAFLLLSLSIAQTTRAVDSEPAAIMGGTAVSDDFNSCSLASQWAFSDPIGDSSMTLNGTQFLIEVPSGQNHDLWKNANTAPRIMQQINNTNFEIEVKFDTTVNFKFQLQGIIIQQDDDNKMRFDFFHDGEAVNVFYAKFENGDVTESISKEIGTGGPMYMRIRREGAVFSQDYKIGAGAWQNHVAITYSGLNVSQAGVFAGNVGTTGAAPAFTSAIDYFFNTASPISPEDPDTNTLSLSTTGQGTLTASPNNSVYSCGEEVTLTIVPDLGWVFQGWSGGLSGHASPYILTVSGDHSATANFGMATHFIVLPIVSKSEQLVTPASAAP